MSLEENYQDFIKLADGRYVRFSDMSGYATKRDIVNAVRVIILVKALFISICLTGMLIYAR